ncbi:MAG: hypothetical protein ACRDUV_13200 [Pseudonocardiaceae bacterium]
MSRHQRQLGLLAIFARLGWQRDPALWSIPCRDGHGRPAELSVRLGAGWVTLDCPAPGPLYLRPRQAGQARAALREAVLDLELFGGADLSDRAALSDGAARPQPAPLAGAVVAVGQRSVLHWRPVTRPTVADVEARPAGATAGGAPEVDHSEPASLLSGAAA